MMIKFDSPNTLCRHWVVLRLVRKLSFRRFLEIGIGDGLFLSKLAKRKYSGKGIDISEEAVKISSGRLQKYKNINIERENFFDTKGKFDLIIMLQVLEHIKEDGEALLKINQLLEEEGKFIFSVPADKKRWGYLDLVGGHYRRYEKQELKQLLINSRLEMICCYSTGFPIVNVFRRWEEFCYKRFFHRQGISRKPLEKRTQASGLIKIPWAMRFPGVFGLLINSLTLIPFFYLQKLFFNTERGENYVVVARKKG